MIDQLWAFLKKDYINASSYKMAFIFQFIGIFFSALSFFFISKLIPNAAVADYGGDYFSFVLIGIALSSFIGLGMGGFATIIRNMQTTGVIETVLTSRTKLGIILVGSLLWSYVITLINIAVYFVLGVFIFGIKVNANIPAVIVVLILNSLCFNAIGIISAGLILIFKRGDPLTSIADKVFALLGGTMYPITIMPVWLQKIAMLLPITHSLNAMRHAVIQNYSFRELSMELYFLSLFALILVPISIVVFKFCLKKAKKEGSLIKY
jgi:ABC-2 type transport system permease protein